MTSADEDEIWRSIVENYGERALPDLERRKERRDEMAESEGQPLPAASSSDSDSEAVRDAESSDAFRHDAESQRFVPPPVPASPRLSPDRRAAWAGVIGAPLLFLLLALTGRSVSGPLAALLLACLVGGFGYLVWTMPNEPRDPFDDGSRV